MSRALGPRLDPEVPAVPEERAAHYRALGLWRPELVSEMVLRGGLDRPDNHAVVDEQRALTHAELATAVTHAMHRLHNEGIRPGDRVGVQLPNCVEYVVLVLALLKLGAPPILILPMLGEHELDSVLATTRPVALAVDGGGRRSTRLSTARRLRDRHGVATLLLLANGGDAQVAKGDGHVDLTEVCRPDPIPESAAQTDVMFDPTPSDAAVFLLSGGTTGPPKVIPRTHESYGYMIRRASEIAGLSADSVGLAIMPAEHGFVFNCPGVLGILAKGGRVVLSSSTSPQRAFHLIERERVTHCALAPTVVMQWLTAAPETTHDLGSLEVVQVGGSRLNPGPAQQIHDVLGATVQQCYGMSEGLLNFTRLDDPKDILLHTQGRPASEADELRVVDEGGEPVPPGQTGELLTRGPYTVAGYYRDPEATWNAFTHHGFYRTGDLVIADKAGNLVVSGRVRDVINRGGEKVSAEELEALTQRHPAVEHSAAVGVPHDLYGETVCLYVVVRDGDSVDLRSLRRFLEQQGLARYKLPERLEIVHELPLTGIGKVDKKTLRRQIRDRVAAEKDPKSATTLSAPEERR